MYKFFIYFFSYFFFFFFFFFLYLNMADELTSGCGAGWGIMFMLSGVVAIS